MICISSEFYDEVACRLLDAIGSKGYFSGSIECEVAGIACRLTASIILYRTRDERPDGDRFPITDAVPVWWEFHTVTPEGEVINDFSFAELKLWLMR